MLKACESVALYQYLLSTQESSRTGSLRLRGCILRRRSRGRWHQHNQPGNRFALATHSYARPTRTSVAAVRHDFWPHDARLPVGAMPNLHAPRECSCGASSWCVRAAQKWEESIVKVGRDTRCGGCQTIGRTRSSSSGTPLMSGHDHCLRATYGVATVSSSGYNASAVHRRK